MVHASFSSRLRYSFAIDEIALLPAEGRDEPPVPAAVLPKHSTVAVARDAAGGGSEAPAVMHDPG
jgi:hypothetical protein